MIVVANTYSSGNTRKLILDTSENTLSYEVPDVRHYQVIGSRSNPDAIDPDGGPCMSVGGVYDVNDDYRVRVLKIRSYNAHDEHLFIRMDVEILYKDDEK